MQFFVQLRPLFYKRLVEPLHILQNFLVSSSLDQEERECVVVWLLEVAQQAIDHRKEKKRAMGVSSTVQQGLLSCLPNRLYHR